MTHAERYEQALQREATKFKKVKIAWLTFLAIEAIVIFLYHA
jgi:hypothetical protein